MKAMILTGVILLAGFISPAVADEKSSSIDLNYNLLIDLRGIYADTMKSRLDGGLGKTRYGTDETGSQHASAQVAEASLIVNSTLSWDVSGMLHLKYAPEQRSAVDVVEGYLEYKPLPSSGTGFRGKAGVFFPPVSYENKGIGWSSVYTVTPSAINTWVGEELKTIGIEGTVYHKWDDFRISATAALFGANDPAGTIIGWQGWGFHDRTVTLADRVSLPPLPTIGPKGRFKRQPLWAELFHEIDGRPGYYVAAETVLPNDVKANVIYYDNLADPASFSAQQYGWETRFTGAGVVIPVPLDMELVAQWMKGDTKMGGLRNNRYPVDVDFMSYFTLLSKPIDKKSRVSVRYDRFSTDSWDEYTQESGHAWTAAFLHDLNKTIRLYIETMQVTSSRNDREYFDLPLDSIETVTMAGAKLTF